MSVFPCSRTLRFKDMNIINFSRIHVHNRFFRLVVNIINTMPFLHTYIHTYTCTHTASFYDCSDDSDGGSSDDDVMTVMIDLMTLMVMVMVRSDDSLEGVAPTPKRRKHAREEALKASLNSGRYPTF